MLLQKQATLVMQGMVMDNTYLTLYLALRHLRNYLGHS